jgi:hypothetical protein|tara:strand:+ start:97 stop:327 length:231 start_codon:yes stop_codon:yes gene_type:complete
MFNRQIIDYKDQRYIVRRRIHEHHLIPDFDTETLLKWANADKLLRKNGFIWCCELIPDAQIVEPEVKIQLELEFPE